MKELIWKELREQRFIPVAMAMLMAAALTVLYVGSLWAEAHNAGTALKVGETTFPFILSLWVPGLFAGSGAIAPEIGNRTIQFLSTFPIGRPKIWTAKVLSGLVVTALSIVASTVAYSITILVMFGWHDFVHQMASIFHADSDTAQLLISGILFAAYGYAVCLFASSLVDRAVVAVVVGLVVAIAVYVAFGALVVSSQIHPLGPWARAILMCTFTAALTMAFLAASYSAFSTGSTMQPAPRNKRALVVLGAGLVISGLLVVTVIRVGSQPTPAAIQRGIPVHRLDG